MFKFLCGNKKKNNPVERLLSTPRHTPGVFTCSTLNVEYTDAQSLYYEYVDIFDKKIYHFAAQRPDPVIIDAGGCVGMSALYFKSVYPQARLQVFEPDPQVFAILKRNMINNGYPEVVCHNVGLGKENAVIDFYSDGVDGGSSVALSGSNCIQIPIVRLSDYIVEPVDFLKMNIEGMEAEVFVEIESKLQLVSELVFEYHAFHDLPQNLGNILNILDRNGFRYSINDGTSSKILTPFQLDEGYRQFNLVYAKRMKAL